MYWQIIRKAGCRTNVEYLERNWPGDTTSHVSLNALQMAAATDAALEDAFRRGGDDEVNRSLQTSSSAEICLNSIGVEVNVLLHADPAAAAAMMAVRPGKLNDILPPATPQAGMDASRNLHRQAERVGTVPQAKQAAPLMQRDLLAQWHNPIAIGWKEVCKCPQAGQHKGCEGSRSKTESMRQPLLRGRCSNSPRAGGCLSSASPEVVAPFCANARTFCRGYLPGSSRTVSRFWPRYS